MKENKAPKSYSTHGSHLIDDRLRVYHQGGLDTYCGFYSILNLVNFAKFKQDTKNGDFIGAPGIENQPFESFIRFISSGGFRGFFPETPFGDCGPEAPMLVAALSRAFQSFNIGAKFVIEDYPRKDPYDPKNWNRYFRPGTERPFGRRKFLV
jgi:hypothetical protein